MVGGAVGTRCDKRNAADSEDPPGGPEEGTGRPLLRGGGLFGPRPRYNTSHLAPLQVMDCTARSCDRCLPFSVPAATAAAPRRSWPARFCDTPLTDCPLCDRLYSLFVLSVQGAPSGQQQYFVDICLRYCALAQAGWRRQAEGAEPVFCGCATLKFMSTKDCC